MSGGWGCALVIRNHWCVSPGFYIMVYVVGPGVSKIKNDAGVL